MDAPETPPNDQAESRAARGARAASALVTLGQRWQRYLDAGWGEPGLRRTSTETDGNAQGSETPAPAAEGMPWEMTRHSLAALVPGLQAAARWRESALTKVPMEKADSPARHIGLILAGNTPLLSWSPIAACLLAGHDVTIKMSRSETLYPLLFRESLAEADPEVARRLTLGVWPGDDPRTAALVSASDAVVAFGADATLAAIRSGIAPKTPFFGFGHAWSIGLVTGDADPAEAGAFADDVLMYGQDGCLSAQAILVEGGKERAAAVAAAMAAAFPDRVKALEAPPISDPAVARAVRQARDLALFEGATVFSGGDLRWTILCGNSGVPLERPTGHRVVSIVGVSDAERDLNAALGAMRGYLSCVGVLGSLAPALRAAIEAQGVSRICAAGQMQRPPLDWPNGRMDLLMELMQI